MHYQSYATRLSASNIFNKIKTDSIKSDVTLSYSAAIKLADEHIAAVGLDAVRSKRVLREVTFKRADQLHDFDLLHVLKQGIEHGDGELGELRAKLQTPDSVLYLGINNGWALVITNNEPAIQ